MLFHIHIIIYLEGFFFLALRHVSDMNDMGRSSTFSLFVDQAAGAKEVPMKRPASKSTRNETPQKKPKKDEKKTTTPKAKVQPNKSKPTAKAKASPKPKMKRPSASLEKLGTDSQKETEHEKTSEKKTKTTAAAKKPASAALECVGIPTTKHFFLM